MTRDIVRVTTGVGLSMVHELQTLLWDMRWMIALCVVLIIVDLIFGIENANAHKEKIRRSRAVRRTVNKFIDYMCWLLFAGVFAKAFAVPLNLDPMSVTASVMLIACLSEVDSIWQNYSEAHNKGKFSIMKFLVKFMKKKNKDVGEALEETIEDDTNR